MATKTQALQDALKLCVKEMCSYCQNEAIARGLELTCVDGCEAYKIAQAALSEPARQCDVGTAEEQFKRYLAFCHSESRGCKHCPANTTRLRGTSNCDLAWAQMPYEAEEGGTE